MRILGKEPVAALNALSAILGLIVSLGVTPLTPAMAGGIVAFVTAVLGAAAAAMTRPIAPQAFTTVVAAGAVLVAAFGFDVSQPVVGAINGAVLALLTLLTRVQVSPVPPTAPASQPATPTAL